MSPAIASDGTSQDPGTHAESGYPKAFRLVGWLFVALIWVSAVVFGISATRSAASGGLGKAAFASVANPEPYVVTLQGWVIEKDGRRRRGSVQTFSVRTDGSSLQRTELLDVPSGKVSERIVYLSSGLRVLVDDLRELRSSTLEAGSPRLRDPKSNCLASYGGTNFSSRERAAGDDEVAGMRTIRVVSGSTTTWYAHESGCAKVKVKRPDYELALVTLELEPAGQELFEIPAYREVPPSEYFRLPQGSALARSRDERYWTKRPLP